MRIPFRFFLPVFTGVCLAAGATDPTTAVQREADAWRAEHRIVETAQTH